ncbi:type VI secretion system Vgr family protein [Bordetella bronchialis]|uniref:Type VI secretion protein Vgr n=1 Tax=Bordetella bronchialis TaxID=463025 RepID=A0A193G593_9BORD|nr:type VI secretion system tip protein TssI/VgrG [Bordetella bronchialis]ANN74389.1 type VI secretion protein Vgr [Bordetella bronchialis]
MDRVVTAHTPLPPDTLLFRAMNGSEGVSMLFEFEVELLAESYALDLRQLLGKPLTLEIAAGLGGRRYLSGQITRFALVGRENATSRLYIYRATVRPWLWYLTQTSDNKIFQNKNVPDIIKEVLADYAFPVEWRLSGVYRNWEYGVQYQETDFDFISRLMEHEGIYYWFRHEQGRHTLVLSDDTAQHDTCPGCESLPYYGPDRVAVPREEYVSAWEPAVQITPSGFATTDFDFRHPGTSMDARRANPAPYDDGKLEIYEWLGGYTDPEQGEHYSRVRLEGLQCRQALVSGACNAPGFAPGYRFTLMNHPRGAENRDYLIIAAHYHMRESGYATGTPEPMVFDVGFTVLPSSVQYRPPRVTPLAYTHGPQTATVVGKDGQQIWTDAYGRIKVQFHWDRVGQRNENSSCWVRVSSPWASGGFGGIQLPRRGDEVVVDFIGGHPDRPIVIGRVYNGANMPPWDLPANATQSGFLSRTQDGTPRTANAFMFEDKPGQEEIWLHAERNMRTEVEADEHRSVDGTRTTAIGGDDTTTIAGARAIHVQGTDALTVGRTRSVTVTDDETYTVNGARTLHVSGGMATEQFDQGLSTTVAADGETRTITGLFKETLNTGQEVHVTAGDALHDVQAGTMTAQAQGQVTMQSFTGGMTLLAKEPVHVESQAAGMDAKAAQQITVTSTGAGIDMKAPQKITLTSDTDVVLNGKQVKDLSTKSWLKATPFGLNLTVAQATFGLGNATVWRSNVGVAVSKADLSAIKTDIFGFSSKIGAAEYKNNGLATETAAAKNLLTGLFTII